MEGTEELQTWFDGLASRTLDLVGDYAGNELFLIEGDSLLLNCFSDKNLNFSHGLQLLHVTYLVERFLSQLKQRKCVFHIVFFSNHAQICIPANVDQRLWSKYRLAREAIVQHLVQNLPAAAPSIHIHLFDGYQHVSFEKYLHDIGAYFLMCHDGTTPFLGSVPRLAGLPEDSDTSLSDDDYLELLDQEEHSNSTPSSNWTARLMLRSMMRWFIDRGYNISILNSLECRDSKVMSIILEGSVSRNRGLCECSNSFLVSPDETLLPSFNVDGHVPDNISLLAKQQKAELTQSEWVTVIALGMMMSEPSPFAHGNLEACALLLHTAILSECRLAERAVAQKRSHSGEIFLERYSNAAVNVLTSKSWHEFITQIPSRCDLGDIIDGNIFLQTMSILEETKSIDSFGLATLKKFDQLKMVVSDMFDINILSSVFGSGVSEQYSGVVGMPRKNKATNVLPFSNPIIDAHLKPVSVVTGHYTDETISSTTSRIFQELSHWHNHKRLLNTKIRTPLTERQKMLRMRRDQFFMKDVTRYAASLTNAVGRSLQPEIVCVKPREVRLSKKIIPKGKEKKQTPEVELHRGPLSSGRKIGGKHVKVSMRDQITTQQQMKQNESAERHFSVWQSMCESFNKEDDYSTRYIQVKRYLEGLSSDKRGTVEVEVLAYMTSTLVLMWKQKCNARCQDSSMPIVALIWHTIQQIAKTKHGVTDEIAQCIQNTLRALKLPSFELPRHGSRKMSFDFAVLNNSTADISVGLSPSAFQLIHTGPYMDRSMGSARDPRVHDFEPDRWQREVLDQIDARESLFVVAPTSAGKTFISFYAIKQILEDSNDGILVIVVPTKALVNQIAAEVQARFSKSFNGMPGKSVWAIHTRDYRINNPTGCQVLITVPHILQIMLLAPSNAKSWSPRIKRIIFDEVHCIGQAEDGVIWEQLLLVAPCPIIALSATVGNPEEFKQWLEMAQKANGLDLRMIQHKTRYSDLRKFIYNPPNKFVFNGLSMSPKSKLPVLGLDESPNMAFLHPIASLIDRSRGLPDDLTLEPRDCLMLWKAMKEHATDSFPIDDHLDPATALPEIIKKADVVEWEAKLKAVVRDWMSDDNSPFEAVVQELSKTLSSTNSDAELQVSDESHAYPTPVSLDKNNLLDTTLPLICSLHDQGALPALFFNYDRANCEMICDDLLGQLEASEKHWKATSHRWQTKLAEFETWQKACEKQALVKEPKLKNRRRGGDDDERTSQLQLTREIASKDSSNFESFNPEDPIRGFHFADEMKLKSSEFEEYATELRKCEVPKRLISALQRGIGVHHAGMNRRYRQVCEILFRKGYLRVVIATGTLALGINMPCKTVVFSGDSIFLTSLNFRQGAGRAGRRGFDFLGNVVFQGLSHQKVCRLLSSRLPDLNGHFPITTSLVLRFFILLHESKNADYAVRAVNSMLSCPRIYLGGPESKHTVLHHLRFSIEYLRRNWLLDRHGAALNFAGMVAHLYYTENSSFAFHALLSDGYFHGLCKNIDKKPHETLRMLMLVLSHLFGRHSLRLSVLESWKARDKSASVVILPQLPKPAAAILNSHNNKTLSVYSAYVTTFIEQHIHDSDSTLPLTGTKCGGEHPAKDVSTSMSFLEPTQVTSSFVALSGHRDEWNSIPELCNVVRSGVWLEQSAIPHVQVTPENDQAPLNAYLYDFFKHGNVHALVNENMVRKGDLWFFLNDFSLVLATIVTTLENYMKLSPGTDLDMLETLGSGDLLEEELDEKALGEDEDQLASTELPPSKEKQSAKPVAIRLGKKTKPKVSDNWEDDISDDEVASQTGGDQTTDDSAGSFLTSDAPADLKGQGLWQVLQAFKMLQVTFNEKFRAMWA